MRRKTSTLSLEATHRGFDIQYDEVDDKWRCKDLGLEHINLSGLKRAIENHEQSDRRVDVMALSLETSYWSDPRDVGRSGKVTVLVDNGEREPREAWFKPEKGSREKVSIENLVPPEHAAMIEKWKALNQTALNMTKTADTFLRGIPRFTAKSLITRAVKGAS